MCLDFPNIDSLQQPRKLFRSKRNRFGNILRPSPRPCKTLLLQPLVPHRKSCPIPVEGLHFVSPSIAKDKQRSLFQHRTLKLHLDQGGKPIDPFAKIHSVSAKINSGKLGNPSHRYSNARINRANHTGSIRSMPSRPPQRAVSITGEKRESHPTFAGTLDRPSNFTSQYPIADRLNPRSRQYCDRVSFNSCRSRTCASQKIFLSG